MSEAAQPPEATAATGQTAGRILREAREAAGLHVATLAVALKVPVRKLEALEDDRYDLLPDAVFVRALASSVCRTLKIDPQPVLEKLPQVATPRLMHQDDGINAPFRSPGEGPRQAWPEQVSKPVVLTVILLLLGAIVLIFLPARHDEPVANGAKPAASAPVAAASLPAPAPAAVPTETASPATAPAAVASAPVVAGLPVPAPAPATPPMVAAAPSPAASMPAAAASRPAPAASVPMALAPASPASAAASAPAPASGVVVFRTTGDSWVKVTDARGTSVLQKLMTAGESAGVSGTLPLTVTVGSVRATAVEVRGQPFDLGPHARDNVARFEVK